MRLSKQFTKAMDNKTQTRNSVITHLETLKNFGVREVLMKSQPQIAVPVSSDLADTSSLEDLRAFIGDCTRCKLCKTRKNIVFGVGNPQAELMFVGEGPGADEDEQGEPFVGRAGQLLTKIIQAMGFERKDVYIGNTVKCRPPENRNPELDELAMCMPFLKQQIQIIKPKVIMCLGKFAAQTILDTQIPISRLRGEFRDVDGIAVMPTFHPAYLLRNPAMKKPMWEDCKKVMEKLKSFKTP